MNVLLKPVAIISHGHDTARGLRGLREMPQNQKTFNETTKRCLRHERERREIQQRGRPREKCKSKYKSVKARRRVVRKADFHFPLTQGRITPFISFHGD